MSNFRSNSKISLIKFKMLQSNCIKSQFDCVQIGYCLQKLWCELLWFGIFSRIEDNLISAKCLNMNSCSTELVVITNCCISKNQIMSISNGSSSFLSFFSRLVVFPLGFFSCFVQAKRWKWKIKSLNIQIVCCAILLYTIIMASTTVALYCFSVLLFNFHFTIISFSFSFENENRRSTIYFVCSEFGAKCFSLCCWSVFFFRSSSFWSFDSSPCWLCIRMQRTSYWES